MKDILNVFFAFVIGAFIVITSLNSCSNSCNNTDRETALEMLDSIKANDPYELNAEWLPYHYHKIYDNEVKCFSDDIKVYKFQYNGHNYLMFSKSKFSNGVVHDPDCPCHNKN